MKMQLIGSSILIVLTYTVLSVDILLLILYDLFLMIIALSLQWYYTPLKLPYCWFSSA